MEPEDEIVVRTVLEDLRYFDPEVLISGETYFSTENTARISLEAIYGNVGDNRYVGMTSNGAWPDNPCVPVTSFVLLAHEGVRVFEGGRYVLDKPEIAMSLSCAQTIGVGSWGEPDWSQMARAFTGTGIENILLDMAGQDLGRREQEEEEEPSDLPSDVLDYYFGGGNGYDR